MKFFKKIFPRLFILFLILLLIILLREKENLEYYVRHLGLISKVILENIHTQMNPPRKFVGNKLEKEDTLKMYVGEPFLSFSYSEWEDFWKIIYGLYRKENPYDAKLPAIYRHLELEEMQELLAQKYPMPFARLQARQWEEFWRLIFSK